LLHQSNGLATTIQFQPGNNGEIQGILEYQATIAGHQKQAASQTHQVNVGVTNNLNVFVGAQVQSCHQADGVQHVGHGTYASELTGQIVGRQQGEVQHIVCNQVSAENTGNHSQIFNQSHIGYHINVGSHHGANGAQLRGLAKQAQLLNQQLNQLIRFCKLSNQESICFHKSHQSRIILHENLSSSSGIPFEFESVKSHDKELLEYSSILTKLHVSSSI